jgi:hypothetical protein
MENAKTQNAMVPVDGFDDDAATESPLRGTVLRFDDHKYFNYSEPYDVRGRTFKVVNKADGWQKLAEGIPPEYRMRKPGQPRPPQPFVDEKDWPPGFGGQQPTHPWKLTRYLYLLDAKSGEVLTFWSNTTGGRVAFDELSDQIKIVRNAQPDAVPIIALESTMMPTQYGTKKPRPFFRIVRYTLRSHIGPQNLLTDKTETPLVEAGAPVAELNDLVSDIAPETPKKKRSKK